MAIARTPLFDGIQKSLKYITFRMRKFSKIEVSKKRIPENPRTDKQKAQRQRYGKCVEQWRKMSDEEKEAYRETAQKLNISLFNAFMMECLKPKPFDYEITIDNTANSNTLENYQILLEITNDPTFFEDCENEQKYLEFYDEDQETLLSHYVEEWDTTNNNAKIWIKIPQIPASSTKKIYLKINKSRTEDLSNPFNVFDFFDDFESYTAGDLNGQGEWSGSVYYDIETTNPYRGSKHVRANVGTGDYKITHPCLLSNNFVITVMAYSHSGSQGGLFLFDSSENGLLGVDPNDEWGRLDLYYDGAWHSLSGEQITEQYVEIKIVVKESTADLYYNGELKAGDVGWSGTIAKFGFYDWNEVTDYDLLIVRKYTEPEPQISYTKL